MGKLKRYLFTGLIISAPIFLTIYVLVVVFNFIDGILGRYLNTALTKTMGFYLPGMGFLATLLLIVLIGAVAQRLFRHRMVVSAEKAFASLPLIRSIYPALKQIVNFVSKQQQFGFKKVVLVEYPRAGCWSLGFMTNDQFDACNKATGKDLVSVYISTTPGPLSGSVFFFAKEDVLFPALGVNEALNIIISGGVFKGEEDKNKLSSETVRDTIGIPETEPKPQT
ncbi:MAG: DUF502 domain-containing protein [Deltaproteobacteria bacterium]